MKTGVPIGLTLFLVLWTTPTPGQPYDDLVIFGDSFSDTGNLAELTTGILPPSPPYAEGRFSDGPLWVESLARELLLDASPHGADGDSNNYAVGAALVSDDIRIGALVIPSLLTQVESFLEDVDDPATDGLYIVFGGHNDVREAASPDAGLSEEEREEVAEDVVAAIIGAITDLADAGAESFLVPNLGNLGRTPEARILENIEESESLCVYFNDALAAELETLGEDLSIEIFTVDLFDLTEAIVEDATENDGTIYGITNIEDPSFEGVGDSPGADPAISLFVDGFHVTAVAQEILAGVALNVVAPPVPFRRGDANADGELGLSDIVDILEFLFEAAERGLCLDAFDLHDDGHLDIADAIYLIEYVFKDGPAPEAPHEECALDPTPGDRLSCVAFEFCAP